MVCDECEMTKMPARQLDPQEETSSNATSSKKRRKIGEQTIIEKCHKLSQSGHCQVAPMNDYVTPSSYRLMPNFD